MDDVLASAREVLERVDAAVRAGGSAGSEVRPTGFVPLDTYLGGGLRAGELTLLGGPQGLGKTTFAVQVARNVAAAGSPVLYFCFEHDEVTLLTRLVGLEAGLLDAGMTLKRVRQAVDAVGAHADGLSGRLGEDGAGAVDAVAAYADRLHLHRSSGKTTSVDAIRDLVFGVLEAGEDRPLVVVDYLQKVAVPDGPDTEEERTTVVVEGLKDLALELGVPVLAIVAADKAGLAQSGRLRAHHLRGSSALAYEADVVLMLDEKYQVVARHHLMYDVGKAERYREYVVVTIEKNRAGRDRIDLEFRKRFELGRFDPDGAPVAEQLTDERIFVD